jgi:hypothetical protein
MMNGLQPVIILACVAAATVGTPMGLYLLLTRKRRATLHAIRDSAQARDWNFRMRHWTGNPVAFRIAGRTRSGLRMLLKSGSARGYDPGWNATLSIRFPELAGEPDVLLVPRTTSRNSGVKMRGVSPEMQAKVAAFSGLAASAIRLLREGRETVTGYPAFDKAYQLSTLGVSWQPLVDGRLAERIVSWPIDIVALHTLLAWRDPFGFYVEARLPAPPNWATICYLAGLAEELCARLPAGRAVEPPRSVVDRLITAVMGKR